MVHESRNAQGALRRVARDRNALPHSAARRREHGWRLQRQPCQSGIRKHKGRGQRVGGGAYQPRADALAAPLAREDYQALAVHRAAAYGT